MAEQDCIFWHKEFKECINGYCYYESNPGITCPKKDDQVQDSAPNNTQMRRSTLAQRAIENEKAKTTFTPAKNDYKVHGKY